MNFTKALGAATAIALIGFANQPALAQWAQGGVTSHPVGMVNQCGQNAMYGRQSAYNPAGSLNYNQQVANFYGIQGVPGTRVNMNPVPNLRGQYVMRGSNVYLGTNTAATRRYSTVRRQGQRSFPFYKLYSTAQNNSRGDVKSVGKSSGIVFRSVTGQDQPVCSRSSSSFEKQAKMNPDGTVTVRIPNLNQFTQSSRNKHRLVSGQKNSQSTFSSLIFKNTNGIGAQRSQNDPQARMNPDGSVSVSLPDIDQYGKTGEKCQLNLEPRKASTNATSVPDYDGYVVVDGSRYGGASCKTNTSRKAKKPPVFTVTEKYPPRHKPYISYTSRNAKKPPVFTVTEKNPPRHKPYISYTSRNAKKSPVFTVTEKNPPRHKPYISYTSRNAKKPPVSAVTEKKQPRQSFYKSYNSQGQSDCTNGQDPSLKTCDSVFDISDNSSARSVPGKQHHKSSDHSTDTRTQSPKTCNPAGKHLVFPSALES